MSLHKSIQVNTRYTRSVNLERDVDALSIIESYIPTTRALRTLDTVVAALQAEKYPRSWSLVGPYGSGKSSIGVFLSNLLGEPLEPTTKAATKKLYEADHTIAEKFTALNESTSGYCSVLLTGSPESLAKRVVESLATAAQDLWSSRRGPSPAVVKRLNKLSASSEAPSTSEILKCVEGLQDALARIGYGGMLVVIDELGKFLEYEARHYGANDIYLLQALAEQAEASHAAKLSLVVMMHQAFEQYARGLGETLRAEWAKVQGRFESIPFLESSEQVIRVLATAIEQDLGDRDKERISKESNKIANALAKEKALPGTMNVETAGDLFARCYPLHPISALLLPLLCQKVAQNERTLFSYLGSREKFGFQDGIERCQKVGDWIYPWEIYEYFILNQSAALTDHVTHRRWAEVVEATERLGDASDHEEHILKAIGLLNIIGAQGGFKASKNLVSLCLPTKAAVITVTKSLSDKSIIQYRKFSAEYRVWQGSDFDIEAAVEIELEKSGRFNLAESLNQRHSLVPIVARKYTIQSGALRYFIPSFVDAETLHCLDKQQSQLQPRIMFCLAEGRGHEEKFKDIILDSEADLDIHVLYLNSDQLRETVAEVLALEQVRQTAQELNSDPVAQREFKDRYNAAILKEESLLNSLTSEPQRNLWFWKRELLNIKSKRSLQEELSRILEVVYSKSPVFKNELINRDKPSAPANAAKNKLAIAMFNNESEKDLGIEKFPAEKAIYRACLREAKLHALGDNGQWGFQGPKSAKKSDDPCNVYAVWKRIDEFLDGTEKQAKSLIDLNLELMAPPYGIKAGILPVLYLAVLMSNQDELAIYEGKIYTPYLTEEQIERFLKRPDEFTVQRFRIEGLNRSIHEVYSSTLYNDGKKRSMLALAKPIAKMVLNLPAYTQSTKTGLSPRAQDVRNVFKLAKSPINLMLDELPKALGIDLNTARKDKGELNKLSKRLMDTLRELQLCLPGLKDEFRGMMATAFSQSRDIELNELREAVAGRCRGLEDYTIDQGGLKPFIQRALGGADDPEIWLDEVLSFLGQKPAEKWNDGERGAAEYRLVVLSRKLLELESLRLQYQKHESKVDGDFEVYLLRSVKKGAVDYEEVVAVDKHRHTAIKAIKSELISVLGDDEELKIAALAELVDEIFAERYKQKNKNPANKSKKLREVS